MHMMQIAIHIAHERANIKRAERSGDEAERRKAEWWLRYWLDRKAEREGRQ